MKDDDFGFPTRTGFATGHANERQMLDSIGGSNQIRTRITENVDGSVTRLKTRAGMPEFVTTKENQEAVGGCLHGLYFDGTITDFGGGSYVVTGGSVLKDMGGIVPVPGVPPILGEVFLCENTILSGTNGRICGGTEVGASTWFCSSGGGKATASILLSRNQPLARADNVPLHQYSITVTSTTGSQTVSGYVSGLVRSNLSDAGEWGSLDAEIFNQHNAVLTDISKDGRKILVEIHECLVVSSAAGDRERLSKPLTFVAAYEIVLTGDIGSLVATASVVVYPRSYYRTDVGLSNPQPVFVGFDPESPPILPAPNWRLHDFGPTAGNGQYIMGVCYDKNDVISCFHQNYQGAVDSRADQFFIGTQAVFSNSWAGTSFYTGSAYDPGNPATWQYRLFYPIRLSNRVFTVAVCDVWDSAHAYTAPYNTWRLSNRASPNGVETTALTLPTEGSWRIAYDFYYRGIEGEVYPYIYGTARAGTGAVASALTKTLCWI